MNFKKRLFKIVFLSIFQIIFFTKNSYCSLFEGSLKFTLAPWESNCIYFEIGEMPDCDIPRPLMAPKDIVIKIKKTEVPGTIARSFRDFNFEDEVKGRIEVYSKYPEIISSLPPYLVIQLWINYPARIFCSTSVKWSKPFNMPPILCASNIDESIRFGMTTILKEHLDF